jgi:hypothetical protein
MLCTELAQRKLHRKKKDREFPVPSRDVTTKLSLAGNIDVITELFLPRGSFVSDSPAGDGKLVNLFLRCRHYYHSDCPMSISYSVIVRALGHCPNEALFHGQVKLLPINLARQ